VNDLAALSLSGIVTACFVVTWIVLGIGGFFLFNLNRDAAFKRKWFPRYMILVGVLFFFFSTTIMALQSRSFFAALGILLVVVPATWVISYLNIKLTRFCDACGATLYHYNWFSPMRFCSKCGAELVAASPWRIDSPGEERSPGVVGPTWRISPHWQVIGFAVADLVLAVLVLFFELLMFLGVALGIARLSGIAPSPDTPRDDWIATAGFLGMFVLYLPALIALTIGGIGLLKRRAWGYYAHLAGVVLLVVSIFGIAYTVVALAIGLRPEFRDYALGKPTPETKPDSLDEL
jgi:hypothetical protein